MEDWIRIHDGLRCAIFDICNYYDISQYVEAEMTQTQHHVDVPSVVLYLAKRHSDDVGRSSVVMIYDLLFFRADSLTIALLIASQRVFSCILLSRMS
jgi:hypothetical protein